MKQLQSARIAVCVLFLGFPVAVLADLSQTTTLQANTTLNLDTGAVASSGGDLLWNGTTIAPQGRARAASVPGGAVLFDSLVEAQLRPFLVLASAAPIPGATLVVNFVFVAGTNGGNVAKVLVTAKSGSTITLKFTTFIDPAPPAGPRITAIQNNSSRIPAGYPNYGIAPSSLFVVVGSGLADPGEPVLQSSAGSGIPLTLNGASITVVVNGVTTHPGLWYTSPAQIAAVLPAATPVGTGTLTVTYRGVTTAPAQIRVVPSAVGINSYNGNLGVATDALTGALLTLANPGSPNQNIVLWTTGLGADPEDSDTVFATSPHSVPTPLQVYVGGVLSAILYQGSSGYPGVNQINLTIPGSAPTGCFVTVVAVTGVVVSNAVTLPISNDGSPCIEALTGLNGTQLSRPDSLRAGLVSIVKSIRPRDESHSANGAFGRYTGLVAAAVGPVVSPGGCLVFPVNINAPAPTFSGLDAGVIDLSGPGGLDMRMTRPLGIRGAYNAILANGAIPQTGGGFTFRGAGGADVGSFTSTIEFSNPLLNWTNQSAAANIDKSQGLLVTWTGGNPGTYVVITGTAGNGQVLPPIVGGFTCVVPVEARQFTVPPYILLGLPPGNGGAEIQNNIYLPLTAPGLDVGLALGNVSISVSSVYR